MPFAKFAFIILCDCFFHIWLLRCQKQIPLEILYLDIWIYIKELERLDFFQSTELSWFPLKLIGDAIALYAQKSIQPGTVVSTLWPRHSCKVGDWQPWELKLWSCSAATWWCVLSETKSQKESCSRRVTLFTLINNSSLFWACCFIKEEHLFGVWDEMCFVWTLVY